MVLSELAKPWGRGMKTPREQERRAGRCAASGASRKGGGAGAGRLERRPCSIGSEARELPSCKGGRARLSYNGGFSQEIYMCSTRTVLLVFPRSTIMPKKLPSVLRREQALHCGRAFRKALLQGVFQLFIIIYFKRVQ